MEEGGLPSDGSKRLSLLTLFSLNEPQGRETAGREERPPPTINCAAIY
jgi:hypothetical protein